MKDLFSQPKPLIGMVHLRALPGTPAYEGHFQAIVDQALQEASIYAQAGIDGLMLENMHDLPYLNRKVGPEITASMTTVAYLVKNAFKLPTGIQILAGANREALAVAQAAGLDYIRAEGFVFGHVADEGWMDGHAGELLRYRKAIGAENIRIWTDIKKKHSAHAATADVDLLETAQAAAFFKSDGLIVTGNSTGKMASREDLARLQNGGELPVLVGSGISSQNLRAYFPLADGFIVGSSLKEQGRWDQPLSPERVLELTGLARELRAGA